MWNFRTKYIFFIYVHTMYTIGFKNDFILNALQDDIIE